MNNEEVKKQIKKQIKVLNKMYGEYLNNPNTKKVTLTLINFTTTIIYNNLARL